MKMTFFSVQQVDDLRRNNLIATQNMKAYNPYSYDALSGTYFIDSAWYASLPMFTRELIQQACNCGNNHIVLKGIPVPHSIEKSFKCQAIYQAYTYSYDYDYWYRPNIKNGPKDCLLIPLSPEEKTALHDCTANRLQDTAPVKPYVKTCDLVAIRKRIESLTDRKKDYFIRLSGTSSKKDETPVPLRRSRSIMDYLTRSFCFLTQEYCQPMKKTSIILMPWNARINARSEFRVFIYDRRVMAIGQQRWSRSFDYTDTELDIVESSILESHFWDDLPYTSLVADVLVDIVGSKSATLIECNPFGSFGPSGSSLFSWSVDRDVLYGKAQAEIRVVRNN